MRKAQLSDALLVDIRATLGLRKCSGSPSPESGDRIKTAESYAKASYAASGDHACSCCPNERLVLTAKQGMASQHHPLCLSVHFLHLYALPPTPPGWSRPEAPTVLWWCLIHWLSSRARYTS